MGLGLSRRAGGGAAAFTPASLFPAAGGWYDPSDLTSMWQDSAGTVPAAVDQPVGKINDKSGNANHRTQATTAAKAVLRSLGGLYWLEYDGVDDSLPTTATVNFSTTDEVTIFAALRKEDATLRMFAELSGNALSNNGAFYLTVGNDVVDGYNALGRGDAAGAANQIATFTAAGGPDVAMLTIKHDISADLSTIRRNSVAGTSAVGDKGLGNFGNYTLYVGSRGGSALLFNGREYGLAIPGKLASAAEVANMETWMGAKAGLTL